MNNILERISQISELENITIAKIEQKIGASKGVLYKAIQKNTDIQSKWLVSIVENFPQYRSEWLLTGKEPILKKDNSKESNDDLFDLQKKYIASLEKIQELQQDNARLQAVINGGAETKRQAG